MTALIASIATTVLIVVGLIVVLAARQLQLQQPPVPVPSPAPSTSGGAPPVDSSGSSSGAVEAAGIDPALLVGRWTDDNDCASALEYTADGRVIAPNGQEGIWQLNGDQLTVTGPTGSTTLRITSIDQSAAYALTADGSVHSFAALLSSARAGAEALALGPPPPYRRPAPPASKRPRVSVGE